jgi:hypothetical protein
MMYLMLLTVTGFPACIAAGPTEVPSTSTDTAAVVPIIDDGGDGCGGGGDVGGGGGGGGSAIPPFNPPPPPFIQAPNLPLFAVNVDPLAEYSCRQSAHVGITPSNDVPRGTVLFGWGVTVPHTLTNFGIYAANGQLVKTHLSHESHDNCVLNQEPEPITTSDMAPGYYYVYASFWKMSPTGVDGDFLFGYALGASGRFVTAMRVQ